jgi:type II secretory pathway pseudopilin PulG
MFKFYTLTPPQLKRKKSTGFTLVELLMYMGLLSILLLILTNILVTLLQAKADSEATSAVEQDGRFVISRLKYDLARASSVSLPAALGATSSSLTMVIDGTNVTYASSSGTLQLTSASGSGSLLSSESTLTNLSFQKLGAIGTKETIKINIGIQSKQLRTQGAESRSWSTTIGRR